MAKHLFVQKVACLEGHRGFEIAKGFFEVTVENIDTRLINLEKAYNIASPPPMLDVTWESLEFRAKRLYQYLPHRALLVNQDDDQPTEKSSVTPQTLRKVLTRLDPKLVLTREPETKKAKTKTTTDKLGDEIKDVAADDEDEIDFAFEAQNLWFAAGKKAWQFDELIKDLDHLYAAAVDLTFQFEKPLVGGPPMPPPGPMIGPGIRGPPIHGGRPPPPKPPPFPFARSRKSCCGCCTCFCHPSPKLKLGRKKRITGGFFRFGWLKNLFSKKKKLDYDSDTSSVTTSSSGSSTAV
ncbi:hypothetical protein E8E14_003168 [Neopestalotiopsis sp. 37M]|nr:hypothetical protein E8E14_003168 [Neopestalotiopsis sp. 37M]